MLEGNSANAAGRRLLLKMDRKDSDMKGGIFCQDERVAGRFTLCTTCEVEKQIMIIIIPNTMHSIKEEQKSQM